jgi:lysophospholipase L1-like esterase
MNTSYPELRLILVGDSDIERWPKSLLPSAGQHNPPIVSGHSGSTLAEILPHVLQQALQSNGKTILVVCAGENDIGSLPLWKSEAALKQLLEETVGSKQNNNMHLIFLGPKFEPWLHEDRESRKSYIQMSRAFQRLVELQDRSVFVDSLTLFCGASARQPGALFKAQPDPTYFNDDQLHLSTEGYRIWKDKVEETIQKMQ